MIIVCDEQILINRLNSDLISWKSQVWTKAVNNEYVFIKHKVPLMPIPLSSSEINDHHSLNSICSSYLLYGKTDVRVHMGPFSSVQAGMVKPSSKVYRPSYLHGHFRSHDRSFELSEMSLQNDLSYRPRWYEEKPN